MKVKLMSEIAFLPQRANPTDAGADLLAPRGLALAPWENKMIDFEVAIELPPHTVGLIFARSGLGSKKGIRPRNCTGVIDEGYRGSIKMMVENASDEPYVIQRGDRIAQLVVTPVLYVDIERVESLNDTERGQGGFGHTGK